MNRSQALLSRCAGRVGVVGVVVGGGFSATSGWGQDQDHFTEDQSV